MPAIVDAHKTGTSRTRSMTVVDRELRRRRIGAITNG